MAAVTPRQRAYGIDAHIQDFCVIFKTPYYFIITVALIARFFCGFTGQSQEAKLGKRIFSSLEKKIVE